MGCGIVASLVLFPGLLSSLNYAYGGLDSRIKDRKDRKFEPDTFANLKRGMSDEVDSFKDPICPAKAWAKWDHDSGFYGSWKSITSENGKSSTSENGKSITYEFKPPFSNNWAKIEEHPSDAFHQSYKSTHSYSSNQSLDVQSSKNYTITTPEGNVTFDEDGDTYLHNSLISHQFQITLKILMMVILKIVGGGVALLNFQNNIGQTALHLTVLTRAPRKVLAMLINAGADLDVRDKSGNSPLHIACRDGYLDSLKLLSKKKQAPKIASSRNYAGYNCLHLAAIHGRLNIVEHLLDDMKLLVNATEGTAGRTALHLAIEAKELTLVMYLLQRDDTDKEAKTYSGYAPLAYASGTRQFELEKLLLAAKVINVIDEDSEEEEEEYEEDDPIFKAVPIHNSDLRTASVAQKNATPLNCL